MLLPQELQSFSYYENKIPLYLKNSYGFVEHFRYWFEVLTGQKVQDNAMIEESKKGIIGSAEEFLALLNIFNLSEEQIENATDVLDMLGKLFGLKRKFTKWFRVSGQLREWNFNLNNAEYLLLIKAQILKSHFDGSREMINQFYEDGNLKIATLDASSNITCDEYLLRTDEISDNVKNLFLSGLLSVESVGVIYNRTDLDILRTLNWDSDNENSVWDKGLWTL